MGSVGMLVDEWDERCGTLPGVINVLGQTVTDQLLKIFG
jgi:hypothetical protein